MNWNAPISVDRRVFLVLGLIGAVYLGWREWQLRRPVAVPPPKVLASTLREAPKIVVQLPPAPEELAGLDSSDHVRQYRASKTLLDRSMTPELEAAIRAAKPTGRVGNAFIHCLEARLRGREGFESALQLPPNLDWPSGDDADEAKCRVEILMQRFAEDPDRVRDILGHYAISMNDQVRKRALDGLQQWPAPALPPSIGEAIYHGGDFEQRLGLEAAIAAGALRNFSKVFDDALEMDELRRTAAAYLTKADDHRGAQILAHRFVRDPKEMVVANAAQKREDLHGDQSAAMAELAIDEHERYDDRRTALEWLANSRDPKIAGLIEPLTRSTDPMLRTYATAAIAQIAQNRR